MIYGERNRIKRILILIGLGGSLLFFILNTSHLLKQYITLNYTHTEVIMPINKYTQEPILSLNYQLLDLHTIKELNASLPDTTLTFSQTTTEIEVDVLKSNQKISLSVLFSDVYNQVLMHPNLYDIYGIEINDTLRHQSSLFTIRDYHPFDDYDLILPDSFNIDSSKSYDNLITVHSLLDIEEVVDKINQHIIQSPYQFQTQPISMNALLLSLVSLVEKLLLGIGFVLFLVSASNLGTIMPYFIGEYKDEITVLKHHGLPNRYIIRVFFLISLTLLSISLMAAALLSWIFTMLISLVVHISFVPPLFKLASLFILQLILGLLSTQNAIKKATETVTY